MGAAAFGETRKQTATVAVTKANNAVARKEVERHVAMARGDDARQRPARVGI